MSVIHHIAVRALTAIFRRLLPPSVIERVEALEANVDRLNVRVGELYINPDHVEQKGGPA